MYAVLTARTVYSAPSAVNVTSLNGLGSALSANRSGGGVHAFTIGPDNNIWMLEHDGGDNAQYVAVAALHSAVVNPSGGAAINRRRRFCGICVFGDRGHMVRATTLLHTMPAWVALYGSDKDGDLGGSIRQRA